MTVEPKTKPMPNWRVVLLRNDISPHRIAACLQLITRLTSDEAEKKVIEAQKTGMSVIAIAHQELAELYEERFLTNDPTISVRIEPDE